MSNHTENQLTQVAEPAGQFSSTTDLLLDFKAMEQMGRLAEMMANGRATVPAHLQGNPADCMAIVMQAAQWRMNPFAVAQKTHVVSGTLGYEAQLVNAVVSSSTKVRDSFHYEWFGDWTSVIGNFITKTSQKGNQYQAPNWTADDEKGLGVRIWATLRGESEPRVLELLLSQAQVRNSTLWASDPKQQLAYLAVKRWARLYAPDVILGVYSVDELEPAVEREINPVSSGSPLKSSLKNRVNEKESEVIEQESTQSDDAPDFGSDEGISADAQSMIDRLMDCYEVQHLENWVAYVEKMELDKDSTDRIALIEAYKNRKASLEKGV